LDYIKTLATLTNKAKQLTHTNTQILKKVHYIKTDNPAFLEEVNQTIEESKNAKNELEHQSTSLTNLTDEFVKID
jgi:CHASE3 domain sensor protein